MNWIDSFTALIQLISAVNFVYIVTHFPSRVLGIIFNKEKLLNVRFSAFTDQINADLQSLETMEPITINDGRSNIQEIESLKEDYAILKDEWDSKRADTETVIDRANSVKGSKCLFLYISLYCIITLFNIAIIKVTHCEFWIVFTFLMNILTFFISCCYTYIIWWYKWDKKENVDCYVRTCRIFIASVLIALVFSSINYCVVSHIGGLPIHSLASHILLSLCIILPFYPCILTIIFVHCHELKVKRLTGKDTSELEKRQSDLHRRKETLDNMDSMFTRPIFK